MNEEGVDGKLVARVDAVVYKCLTGWYAFDCPGEDLEAKVREALGKNTLSRLADALHPYWMEFNRLSALPHDDVTRTEAASVTRRLFPFTCLLTDNCFSDVLETLFPELFME